MNPTEENPTMDRITQCEREIESAALEYNQGILAAHKALSEILPRAFQAFVRWSELGKELNNLNGPLGRGVKARRIDWPEEVKVFREAIALGLQKLHNLSRREQVAALRDEVQRRAERWEERHVELINSKQIASEKVPGWEKVKPAA